MAPKKSEVISFSSLEEMANVFNEAVSAQFEIKEKKYSVDIRPLNAKETQSAGDMVDLIPPKIKKPSKTQPGGFEEEYDYLNSDFMKKRAEAASLQRAYVLDVGVVSLEIPGKSLEEKRQYLEQTFPARLLDFLYDEIMAISTGDLKVLDDANFTSGADSAKS